MTGSVWRNYHSKVEEIVIYIYSHIATPQMLIVLWYIVLYRVQKKNNKKRKPICDKLRQYFKSYMRTKTPHHDVYRKS